MKLVIPQSLIAEVGKSQIGIRETSRNRGPGLDKFWRATSYPSGEQNREPWCAAFVSWCVQQADRKCEHLHFPIPPRFAAVKSFLPWARRKNVGCLVFGPDSKTYRPQPGDLVVFTFSHIGIVTGYNGGNTVHTVEGNTNAAGSREGNGVYAKKRNFSSISRFIRLPVRPD